MYMHIHKYIHLVHVLSMGLVTTIYM